MKRLQSSQQSLGATGASDSSVTHNEINAPHLPDGINSPKETSIPIFVSYLEFGLCPRHEYLASRLIKRNAQVTFITSKGCVAIVASAPALAADTL